MGTAVAAPRMERFFKLCIWAALYLLPVTRALAPHIDQDSWWHLRTGETIVNDLRIPATDTFSRHGLETDKPWLAYSWLFEVILYGVYKAMGLSGFVILRLVLVLAVSIAVHRFIARLEPRFVVAASLFAAAMLALQPLMSERPWLFTILFSTLLLDGLLDWRAKRLTPKWHLLFPAMFVVWANLHIQFIYGLLMLGIACLAPWADRLLARYSVNIRDQADPAADTIARAGSKAWWALVAVTGLCALATLVNPYGVRLYEVVMDYGTHQAPLSIVTELRPLEFRDFRDYIMPALAAVALVALGRRKQWSCFEILMIIAAGWFSFRMRRDVWFMTLVSLGIYSGTSRRRTEDSETDWAFVPSRPQAVLLTFLVVVMAVITWKIRIGPDAIETRLAEDYPVGAVRFVKSHGYAGPLYNTFDWGGYLIWNLRELPVSMDGRTNLHGDARLTLAYATWSALPGWDRDPDLFTSSVIIEDADAPVSLAMQADQRFKLVYADKRAVVFEVVHHE